jgi:crotonobetainyl-CoA:carnitine CoA-transferase CaiB-like acyl-CoA transferase
MHPVELDSGVLPLSDVTVVDLTQVLAGPFASMTLGDMGAEVIKIEAIGRGDRSRGLQPSPEYFDMANRNKHSIALDLKSDDGQAVARRLLSEADVFIPSCPFHQRRTRVWSTSV